MLRYQTVHKACGLIVCLVLLASCSDFLQEDPQDRIAQNNYYSTEQDAISAVNSVYANLGSYSPPGNTRGVYHSIFWVTAGLASDNMYNERVGAVRNEQLESFSYTAENENLLEIWQMHYKTITLANTAIERIPGIDMDEEVRTRLVNESKFLRALMYYNLVRMFGSVPLVIAEEAPLTPASASVEEVYSQIISDLTDAEALPADGNIQEGRATSGAATALLAKVYLEMENYEQAAAEARTVIDSGTYELWDSFQDAFKVANRGGKEAIFSVGFGDAGGAISFWEVGQFNVRLLPPELSVERANITNTQGWQIVTEDLYNDYSPDDERRNGTFMTQFQDDDGNTINLENIYVRKYWDEQAEPNPGAGSVNDFPVIRYAEILLIYAEAQAELGNFEAANQYLNEVRDRAGLGDVNITDLTDFKEAILSERRKEFVAEGKRWFDLVRMDRLEVHVQQAKDVTFDSRYYLFPIPQRELDNNPNLIQNSGY